MATSQTQFLDVGEADAARRIAVQQVPRQLSGSPGLVWLSGFKSDMASTKAQAVAAFAHDNGLPATLFDYSGHGRSSGRFEDGTISRWLEEAVAVFRKATEGPQVVIGSSMGGYIALLLLARLIERHPADARRLRALVLIAPAWDMTETLIWAGLTDQQKQTLLSSGAVLRPTPYGEPYAITRALIEDGRRHVLAGRPFDPGRPVLILQGALDPDVPLAHTRALSAVLLGGWIDMVVVADGEHRLSRAEDLAQFFALVRRALAASDPGS